MWLFVCPVPFCRGLSGSLVISESRDLTGLLVCYLTACTNCNRWQCWSLEADLESESLTKRLTTVTHSKSNVYAMEEGHCILLVIINLNIIRSDVINYLLFRCSYVYLDVPKMLFSYSVVPSSFEFLINYYFPYLMLFLELC